MTITPVAAARAFVEACEELGVDRKALRAALLAAFDGEKPPRGRKDAARWRWLADDMDGDGQDDFICWMSNNLAGRSMLEAVCDLFMEANYRTPESADEAKRLETRIAAIAKATTPGGA